MTTSIDYRTCPLCEATCGLEVTHQDERVIRIRGDREDVFSHGFICPKGSTLGKIDEDPDRVRVPLIKRGDRHEPATWDEAFALIEARLLPIIAEHGNNSVGVYLGNPNVHSMSGVLYPRVFLKMLGTKSIFSAATVDQMPKHVSSGLMFGHPDLIPVPDIDRTSYLLMLGANPYESNGSLATAPDWPGRLQAIRERGGKVVVVDPRRTRTAEAADEHVFIRPGADALFLFALANVLFEEGLVDPGGLEGHVAGADELAAGVEPFTPEEVGEATGVDPDRIRRLARELAGADSAAVYGRIGTHTAEFGTMASWMVDVLNVLTGNLDRPGGAMFSHAAHEQPRSPRGFQVGRWQSRVKGLPEVRGELPVSTMADEILEPGPGQIRAARHNRRQPDSLHTLKRSSRCRPRRPGIHGVGGHLPQRDDTSRRRHPSRRFPASAAPLRLRLQPTLRAQCGQLLAAALLAARRHPRRVAGAPPARGDGFRTGERRRCGGIG